MSDEALERVAGPASGGPQRAESIPVPGQAPNQKSPYEQDRPEIPKVELPKGGGALKSIDEKFQVNAANGTASLSLPLPLSKARGGFAPSLTLGYDSGGGNGTLGLGWSLGQVFIQRRTDKLLPRYRDAEESDVFVLSGAEDLVPALVEDAHGNWSTDVFTAPTGEKVKRYRPRIESDFARIEQITPPGSTTFYWKATSRDNVVTFYGLSAQSRLVDPSDASRVFRWLPDLAFDDKGNCLEYGYLAEDFRSVPSVASEANRLNGLAACANTYLKWVKYGNQAPYAPNLNSPYSPPAPANPGYFFQVVVDYGDHDPAVPTPDPQRDWPCRLDPFSRYKSGFDVRTYRLAQRVLVFHFFKELNDGVAAAPCLVRSVDFAYRYWGNPLATPQELRNMEVDFPIHVTLTHYRKNGAGYDRASFPPLDLSYQPLAWNHAVQEMSQDDLAGAPAGLSRGYQWVDLWSEGISGILSEQGQGWFYKRNLGDGTFAAPQLVMPKPSFTGLAQGSLTVQDLEADGRKAVVVHSPPLQGSFPLSPHGNPEPFRAFERTANAAFEDPNVRFVDLDGDGRADLLVSEDAVFRWYPCLGALGYGAPELAAKSHDEEKGPALVFSDPTGSIFLADMTGDGLTDVVRIRNGEVCYWPNLGFGRFGAKVTMDAAPVFDTEDGFNPTSVHLGDVSGTGATDLLYLGQGRFRAWLNQGGNGWSEVQELDPFPPTENGNQLSVADLLGNGTSCLVWSSPLPRYAARPMRYVDLMGGKKPYLLTGYANNLGKSVTWEFKSSTQYYLADELAGTPWATRLPFPVHCVSQVSFTDSVTRAYLSRQYSYHHGYYDSAEREYRGFGRVEQTDSETFDEFAKSGASNVVDQPLHQAPALTKTWFHTGVFFDEGDLLARYRLEFFQNTNFAEHPLPVPPTQPGLNAQERREAARACKGKVLRQEVYGLDGGPSVPFSAEEHSWRVQQAQPLSTNRYAVFVTTEAEAITYAYERNDADPRIAHTLNTRVDELGNVLEAASVAYPRSAPPAGLPSEVTSSQARLWATYATRAFTTDVLQPAAYRLRQMSEAKHFELLGATPGASYFVLDEVANAFATAQAIPYEATPSGALQKRLLKQARTIFLKDDLSGPLPLGQLATLGLVYQAYHLALTDTLANSLYGARVTPALLTEGQYASSQSCKAAGFFPATDPDNQWWVPSGRALYPANAATTFYLPDRVVDAWGHATTIGYYGNYQLLVSQLTDAVGNTVSALAFEWRVLAPQQIRDANDDLTEVRFDLRGQAVGTSVEGKGSEADNFTGFATELTPTQTSQFFGDPATYGPNLLQNATQRFVYDFSVTPVRVATLSRETHFQAAQQSGTPSRLQYLVEYTGGFGQVVMRKAEAKPGLAKTLDGSNNVVEVDTAPKLRWVGTGRTVFNNKGNPVMQYEPYFSVTPAYEDEPQLVEIGVTTVTQYDAPGRVVRVDNPNGSFTLEVREGWRTTSSDANDTVKSSQWYLDRTTGPLSGDLQENQAAQKAAVHDSTPVVKHLDGLGRAFFRVDDNRYVDNTTHLLVEKFFNGRTVLDVEGNSLGVVDARGNSVVQYAYDMLGGQAQAQSMDSGERWALNDVFGKRLYVWDSKQRTFHTLYDALHRSVKETVLKPGALQPILYAQSVYGEGQVSDKVLNLRGRLYQAFEPCGVSTVPSYDFKGNALAQRFAFTVDFQNDIDWSSGSPPPLQTDVFVTQTQYDALNRPIRVQGPSANPATADVSVPTYNETRRLEAVDVYLRGSATPMHMVANLDYDEKGQRQRIDYGNGVSTVYKYDPLTFRLIGLVTARNSDPESYWDNPALLSNPTYANDVLQFLTYTFDPVGNPTYVLDQAQEVIYFNNAKVDPSADYTYDSVYRLIQALGREHIGQSKASDPFDAFRMGNPQPGDGTQMQRYTQQYAYDDAGNLTALGNAGSWSRAFTNAGNSNQLLTAPAAGDAAFTFTYDAHGCMLAMPQLSTMDWDFGDRLRHVVMSPSASSPQEAWYGYGNGGARMRKVVKKGALTEERLYVGNFERFRRYSGSTVVLERESYHVTDDTRRVALVDAPTVLPSGSAEKQLVRYQLGNHLGSACVEVDDAAQIISYEEYYPFGSTSYQGVDQTREVPAKRYRYTAKERDEESGLEYHAARYCAPWLGRWTQADPAGLAGGPNRYCYASNNPVRLVDPSGKQPTKPVQPDEAKPPPPPAKKKDAAKAPGDVPEHDEPKKKKEPADHLGRSASTFNITQSAGDDPSDAQKEKKELSRVVEELTLSRLFAPGATVGGPWGANLYVRFTKTREDTEEKEYPPSSPPVVGHTGYSVGGNVQAQGNVSGPGDSSVLGSLVLHSWTQWSKSPVTIGGYATATGGYTSFGGVGRGTGGVGFVGAASGDLSSSVSLDVNAGFGFGTRSQLSSSTILDSAGYGLVSAALTFKPGKGVQIPVELVYTGSGGGKEPAKNQSPLFATGVNESKVSVGVGVLVPFGQTQAIGVYAGYSHSSQSSTDPVFDQQNKSTDTGTINLFYMH